MKLVIVESPTKAKTISKFLPSGFKVESSFGHVRDLPKGTMGVDMENDFKPKYVVPKKAEKLVSKLKSLAKKSDEIYFAADEDREGEAIAWHLKEILKPEKYKRITFHEITKKAIENAIEHPRKINLDLVDAQQARRILDRLVGYNMSPFLWKKVAKGLSAGRVQSVTVRLVVEREREIEAFKKDEFWTIEAIFDDGAETPEVINAKLHSVDGKTLKKLDIKDEKSAKEFLEKIKEEKYKVTSVKTKRTKKKVPTPFKTSTLQQAANNKLGFSSKQTMMLAQQLYEGVQITGKEQVGLITYMRTDSLNLSDEFLKASQTYIKEKFGDKYAPKESRVFKTKSKGAQEAHEAIRPSHVDFEPDSIRDSLDEKQYKLYKLIWSRSIATQMNEAEIDSTSIDVADEKEKFSFRATGQVIIFDGFLKVYQTETKENLLPALKEGQSVDLKKIEPKQHFTQPPARYTEASLVKILEEYGIGRPSTYAPTLSTIEARNYVVKEEKRFKPTDMGIIVTDLLVEHFPNIVDYQFTAKMEEDLDEIAEGKKEWVPIIKEFYVPFKKNLDDKEVEVKKDDVIEAEETDEKCDKCGKPMAIKMSRFGKFLGCTGYPECKTTKPLKENEKGELEIVEPETTDEKCEDCGAPLVMKHGRFGKFFGCSKYPDCKYIKSIAEKTGAKCPQCKKGDIVERKSKKGRTFYSCDGYPKCKFIMWGKPTGDKCPDCESLLVFGPKDTVRCSKKDCGYTK